MDSYELSEQDVFNVFDSDVWKAYSINAYPVGFRGKYSGDEYLRISVIHSGNSINKNSKSGVLMIEIFTAWGGGPRASTRIADKLDKNFQRSYVGRTQYSDSTLGAYEVDRDNKALGRAIYSIPFTFYGVS